MAEVHEGAECWLPTKIFTDDEEEKFKKTESVGGFCFPTEFPYHFEAEKDKCLESFVMSTSPQSTLVNWLGPSAGGSSIGLPTVVHSTPTTSFGREDNSMRDQVNRVSDQVTKLKMNSGHTPYEGLLPPPRSHLHPCPVANPYVFHNTPVPPKQKNESCGMGYDRQLQIHRNQVFGQNLSNKFCSTPSRRECSGTGVFLPRRYALPSDSRRQVSSSTFLQERNVCLVPKNLENVKVFPQTQSQFNGGIISDYDLLMARRNKIMLHYRSLLLQKSMIRRDRYLPQEWNY